MLKSLFSALEELVVMQEQLIELSLQKKQLVIEGNIDQLAQLIQQESKLVRQLGKLEEERMFQVKEYCLKRGLLAEDITLQQLITLISGKEEKERLTQLARELESKIIELQQINDLNAKLIQDSLDYINRSIELMTDSPDDSFTYQRPNQPLKLGVPNGRSIFDTKA